MKDPDPSVALSTLHSSLRSSSHCPICGSSSPSSGKRKSPPSPSSHSFLVASAFRPFLTSSQRSSSPSLTLNACGACLDDPLFSSLHRSARQLIAALSAFSDQRTRLLQILLEVHFRDLRRKSGGSGGRTRAGRGRGRKSKADDKGEGHSVAWEKKVLSYAEEQVRLEEEELVRRLGLQDLPDFPADRDGEREGDGKEGTFVMKEELDSDIDLDPGEGLEETDEDWAIKPVDKKDKANSPSRSGRKRKLHEAEQASPSKTKTKQSQSRPRLSSNNFNDLQDETSFGGDADYPDHDLDAGPSTPTPQSQSEGPGTLSAALLHPDLPPTSCKRVPCPVCSKPVEFRRLEGHLRAHEKESAKKKKEQEHQHPCPFSSVCDKSFPSAKQLQKHVQDKHGFNEDEDEDFSFPTEVEAEEVEVEVEGQHDQHQSEDETQDRASQGQGQDTKPEGIYPTPTLYKRVPCPICSKMVEFRHLQGHIRNHDKEEKERPFACTYADCGKSYTTERILRQHIREAHEYEEHLPVPVVVADPASGNWKTPSKYQKVPCPICSKPIEFRRLKPHLRTHETATAAAAALLSCGFPDCDKRFSSEALLSKHLRKVHNQNQEESKKTFLECKYCLESYQPYRYHEHLRRTHRLAAYHCSACSAPFFYKTELDKHFEEQHEKENEANPEAIRIEVRAEERPVCNVCKLTFKSRKEIEEHILEKSHVKAVSKRHPLQQREKQRRREDEDENDKDEMEPETDGDEQEQDSNSNTITGLDSVLTPPRLRPQRKSATVALQSLRRFSQRNTNNTGDSDSGSGNDSESDDDSANDDGAESSSSDSDPDSENESVPANSSSSSSLICPVCNLQFPSIPDLNAHLDTHPSSGKPFQCLSCSSSFPSRSAYHTHLLSTHSQIPLLTCQYCDTAYDTFKLTNHLRVAHNILKEKSFRCTEPGCSLTFYYKSNLLRHKENHGQGQNVDEKLPSPLCRACKITFLDIAEFDAHILTDSHVQRLGEWKERNGSKRKGHNCFCRVCGLQFENYPDYKAHLQEESHLRKKEEYDLIQAAKRNYSATKRSRDPNRRIMCHFCVKTASTRALVREHMFKHHRDLYMGKDGLSFVCDSICYKKFKTGEELKEHLDGHEQIFKCHICSKEFKRRAYLTKHKKTHSEDQTPIICEICGKVYKNNKVLKEHQRRHAKDYHHKCPDCRLAFLKPSELAYHLPRCKARREGDYPLRCDLCRTGFKRKSLLIRHVRKCKERFGIPPDEQEISDQDQDQQDSGGEESDESYDWRN